MDIAEYGRLVGTRVRDNLGVCRDTVDESALVDAALEAFETLRKPFFSWQDILAGIATKQGWPDQRDNLVPFGEPTFTLFEDPRFVVRVHVWSTSTTCIHNHPFFGAFQVLCGESIETRYVTEDTIVESGGLTLANLRQASHTLHHSGTCNDIRCAPAGNGLLHSIIHLDYPMVTLVVKTRTLDPVLSRRFFFPGVSFASLDNPTSFLQMRALKTAWLHDGLFAETLIESALRAHNAGESVRMALTLFEELGYPSRLQALLAKMHSERFPQVSEGYWHMAYNHMRRSSVSLTRAWHAPRAQRGVYAALLSLEASQVLRTMFGDASESSTTSLAEVLGSMQDGTEGNQAAARPFARWLLSLDKPVRDLAYAPSEDAAAPSSIIFAPHMAMLKST